jgi:hypothetical protein
VQRSAHKLFISKVASHVKLRATEEQLSTKLIMGYSRIDILNDLTIYRSLFGDGAVHQHCHAHPDACDAFLKEYRKTGIFNNLEWNLNWNYYTP